MSSGGVDPADIGIVHIGMGRIGMVHIDMVDMAIMGIHVIDTRDITGGIHAIDIIAGIDITGTTDIAAIRDIDITDFTAIHVSTDITAILGIAMALIGTALSADIATLGFADIDGGDLR
jgi:hypothetical protein